MIKASLEKIVLQSDETFACREFRVPRFEMPWHFHPELELTLIVQGRGTRYVGDNIERFRDGDLVLLGENLPHYWWKDAGDRREAHSVVVQFGIDFAGSGFLGMPEAAGIRRLFSQSRRGMKFSGKAGESIATDMMKLVDLSGWKRLCLLLEIFGRLAELRSVDFLASASFRPQLEELDGRRLTAVCRYVNEHYAGAIQQTRAATLAGLSPAAFSRFFRKRMGKTFEAYVNEVRIGHACRLMLEADGTILEAALGCGFNNLSNFNRQFLRLKGRTPRQYRRLFDL